MQNKTGSRALIGHLRTASNGAPVPQKPQTCTSLSVSNTVKNYRSVQSSKIEGNLASRVIVRVALTSGRLNVTNSMEFWNCLECRQLRQMSSARSQVPWGNDARRWKEEIAVVHNQLVSHLVVPLPVSCKCVVVKGFFLLLHVEEPHKELGCISFAGGCSAPQKFWAVGSGSSMLCSLLLFVHLISLILFCFSPLVTGVFHLLAPSLISFPSAAFTHVLLQCLVGLLFVWLTFMTCFCSVSVAVAFWFSGFQQEACHASLKLFHNTNTAERFQNSRRVYTWQMHMFERLQVA